MRVPPNCPNFALFYFFTFFHSFGFPGRRTGGGGAAKSALRFKNAAALLVAVPRVSYTSII